MSEPAAQKDPVAEKDSAAPPASICPQCDHAVAPEMTTCPKCSTIVHFDPEQYRDLRLGQILLTHREYLFESIYRDRQLIAKMLYCVGYALLFSAIYGAILGAYFGLSRAAVMAVKVPLVLFGTLLIAMPVLFTFNIFIGTRLYLRQVLTLLLVCNYLTSLVLISLAPILLLFVIYSDSLSFILILNLISLIVAAGLGIGFLWQGMRYFTVKNHYEHSPVILSIWSVIYVFVGMQFAWSLSVFGDLMQLPVFKRLGIEGNFYMALFRLIKGFIAPEYD